MLISRTRECVPDCLAVRYYRSAAYSAGIVCQDIRFLNYLAYVSIRSYSYIYVRVGVAQGSKAYLETCYGRYASVGQPESPVLAPSLESSVSSAPNLQGALHV